MSLVTSKFDDDLEGIINMLYIHYSRYYNIDRYLPNTYLPSNCNYYVCSIGFGYIFGGRIF